MAIPSQAVLRAVGERSPRLGPMTRRELAWTVEWMRTYPGAMYVGTIAAMGAGALIFWVAARLEYAPGFSSNSLTKKFSMLLNIRNVFEGLGVILTLFLWFHLMRRRSLRPVAEGRLPEVLRLDLAGRLWVVTETAVRRR